MGSSNPRTLKMFWTILVCTALSQVASAMTRMNCTLDFTGSVFDYPIYNIDGETLVDWTHYEGNMTLVVNVASFSVNTYQYPQLNLMQSTLDPFLVLGIPCNQFAFQEPGANATEILNSLYYVRPGNGYAPNFELTTTVNINGGPEYNEHPIYSFLKDRCSPPILLFEDKDLLEYDNMMSGDIRWNFEKFLIDRQGVPIYRYSDDTEPFEIIADICSFIGC